MEIRSGMNSFQIGMNSFRLIFFIVLLWIVHDRNASGWTALLRLSRPAAAASCRLQAGLRPGLLWVRSGLRYCIGIVLCGKLRGSFARSESSISYFAVVLWTFILWLGNETLTTFAYIDMKLALSLFNGFLQFGDEQDILSIVRNFYFASANILA